MKKSFMTRVLAVSLSAAMAFSMSSASNLMTASAASTVNLKTTFKTLKVNQTYQLKLTNNTLNWKITKVTTSNKKICTVYNKKASSVMLKGKGVGRAKIKVKVKTTKRKYPKNIKYMTCTANVKAADNPVTPDANAFSATVTPVSLTQVRVTFNKAVDDASDASKFTISDGVKVTKSDPEADKLSTVLTIEGAEAGKSYDLTVKGLAVNGAAQADLNLKFTAPSEQTVDTGYKLIVTPAQSIVKSDGQTQTRVTFEVQKGDKTVTDQTAQIEFSASRGRFADTRATLKDGKVEVMYSAPQETVSVPAVITATVVESSDPKMIGTQGVGNITLSPNPDNLTSEAAIITSAAAGTADRVIAYFDKEVNADDFMKDGRPDKTKFDCEIRTGLDSAFTSTTGTDRTVVAILPVANEPKALEILVDRPLTDNSNASVKFKDKRSKNNGIDTTNTVNFRLADAREPSVLAVESSGTKKIEVTFSEAVVPSTKAGSHSEFAADNIANYLIDGRPLSSFGVKKKDPAKEIADTQSSELDRKEKKYDTSESFSTDDGELQVQIYSVSDKKGTDNRHKVTITVGSGHVLAAGTHMLTVRNVGDWAAATDAARNSISTQVLPFTVTENAEKPEFTVNIQSPEQYELNFNTSFKVVDSPADQFKTRDSSVQGQDSILQLQEYVNGAWTTISNSTTAMTTRGQNPVSISQVDGDDKKFLVEVRRDWSDVYDFNNTRTDYYNKRLRLHLDAGKLVNVSNNLRNDEINIELNANDPKVTNGSIMGEADLTSPTVTGVTQAVGKNGSLLHSWNVEFSEPIKISASANKEGLTPSQRQQSGQYSADEKVKANQGVPVAFARFVNVSNPSTIIEGIVDENNFVDAEDKIINIEPERKLSGGDWRLVVGSISDDYGSTLATDGQVITVDETTASTDFKVVWAAVSQTETYNEARMGNVKDEPGYIKGRGSYVFVKFNKAVDLATALNENNYALNNQPLPQGASIQANIKGYDDHDNTVDSVTIALPTNSNLLYQNYTVDTLKTQISINGVVAQGTGEALSGSGMNQLPYNIGEYTDTNEQSTKEDGVKIPNGDVTKRTDAVWGNDASEQHGNAKDNIQEWSEYYEALRAALDNDQYRKVIIQRDAFDNLDAASESEQAKAVRAVFGRNLVINISRAVDVDFNDAELKGNVVVSTTDAVDQMLIEKVTIKGPNEKIRGNSASLTVNAGVVKHFVFDGKAEAGKNDNAILLNDVWTQSFELGEHASVTGVIYVTDTNGFGFENKSAWAGNLVINSNGVVNLKGWLKGANITLEQAATLNLGTLAKDAGADAADAVLDGAVINIKAAETKVMITEASKADTAPAINIIGKDVKVYLGAENKTGWLKAAGGNVVEINDKGKPITSSNLNNTVQDKKGGMKKILDSLEIIPGVNGDDEISYADYQTITTGDAFVTNSETNNKLGIDVKAMARKIANDTEAKAKVSGYELVNADGTEIDTADFSVTVALADTSNAKIFEQKNGYICPKATEGSGTDTIIITIAYAGNTYTRNIKVAN